MSLHEAYYLACSAQSRLTREIARPNRSLRFMVGHLAHYDSLRARIDDLEKNAAASHQHVSSSTTPVDHRLQISSIKSSSSSSSSLSSLSSLSSSSSSPVFATTTQQHDEHDFAHDDYFYDDDNADDEDAGLSLTRCHSRCISPPPPELDSDDSDDSDSSDGDSDGESDDEHIPAVRYMLEIPTSRKIVVVAPPPQQLQQMPALVAAMA